jgi:hypothetical protein
VHRIFLASNYVKRAKITVYVKMGKRCNLIVAEPTFGFSYEFVSTFGRFYEYSRDLMKKSAKDSHLLSSLGNQQLALDREKRKRSITQRRHFFPSLFTKLLKMRVKKTYIFFSDSVTSLHKICSHVLSQLSQTIVFKFAHTMPRASSKVKQLGKKSMYACIALSMHIKIFSFFFPLSLAAAARKGSRTHPEREV